MKLQPLLAVIPARGGSKGLPGKNIRPLAGMPLIAHSIACAQLTPAIARCIVSTDCAEIADVARRYGGEVPFMRPAALAADDTPMLPALKHALRTMEAQDGCRYEALLLLDPTSPGRTPQDIERALALLEADLAAQGVVACSRPTFNPFWVGVVEQEGYMQPAFADAARYQRRQDVPPFFRVNGALYLWRRDHLLACSSSLEGKLRLLEMPELRAFSIDDEMEFQLAEMLLERGVISLPWLDAGASTA